MTTANASNKTNPWVWLAWWRIDPAQLDIQVSQYESLGFIKSMRGISVLLLAFSATVTLILASFSALGIDSSAFIDVGLMAVLAVFIYLGHRWAILCAMVLWTAEKVLTAVDGLGTAHVSGGLVIGQFLWWCTYMHAFYFTFRIERERRALVRVVA